MISFRAVDGETFNRIDDAIAYETQRYASSMDKHRRGKGSPEIREALRKNLLALKRYKRQGFAELDENNLLGVKPCQPKHE